MIQAIETTGTISTNGSLVLDHPLQVPPTPQPVRVIILVTESLVIESTAAPQTLATPPIWEQLTAIAAQAPDAEWQKLPTDLAMNFDAYQSQTPQP